MADQEDNKIAGTTDREQLFGFLLQQRFDGRYVLKDGVYKLIVALVVGAAGLILTGVVMLAFNFYLHAPK